MQLIWLGVAIVGAAAYHVVLKLTPAGVNPYLSLAVTYAVVTAAFAAAYLVFPAMSRRAWPSASSTGPRGCWGWSSCSSTSPS